MKVFHSVELKKLQIKRITTTHRPKHNCCGESITRDDESLPNAQLLKGVSKR